MKSLRNIVFLAAIAVATGVVAACHPSPDAQLEEAVVAELARTKLPEQAEFPALNSEMLTLLARNVPGLAERLPEIGKAERANLAKAADVIGKRAASPPAGAAHVRDSSEHASLVAPTWSFEPASWLVPSLLAQIDVQTVTAALTGMSSGALLGQIVGGGSGGETATDTTNVVESEGHAVVLDRAGTSDGTMTATLTSDMTLGVLGVLAGSRVSMSSKNLCPDADGKVEFTIRSEQRASASAAGSALAESGVLEATAVVVVNDNGEIASIVARTHYDRQSIAPAGTTAVSGSADWTFNGTAAPEMSGYQAGKRSGSRVAELETNAAAAAAVLGRAAVEGAKDYWQLGHCIEIQAKEPYIVEPNARTPIPVRVVQKREHVDVPARVDARLEVGGASLDPVVIRRAPGTIEHTAPDAKGASITVRLSAKSRRGNAVQFLQFRTRGGQAYRIVSTGNDPVDQVECSFANPFVLEGRMFGVALSGGLQGTWTFVRTPSPLVKWSASGDYTITFPDGPDKPGVLKLVGQGTTTAGGITRTFPADETFTVTPTEDAPGCSGQ